MSFWTGNSVDAEHVTFAQRAAAFFREHPSKHTFTVDDIESGELLAIKWAFDGDKVFSVAVVRVSSAVLVENP